ncbi:MAG: methionyl-tRNA formyltransferase [Rhodoluna sp.]
MKYVFAGTPENAAQTLSSLIAAGFEFGLVLTRTDSPVGRSRKIEASPVAKIAEAAGIPLLKTNQLDKASLEKLRDSGCALGIVVAYGLILKPAFLEALPMGWINVHYSLLPELRGAAPVQQALIRGYRETGISIFQLDEGMDTGPIYLQIPTRIEPFENSRELLNRLTHLGISGLMEVIPALMSGTARAKPQDISNVTFAPKIQRDQAIIDWNSSSAILENQIRGLNPEPMAWTKYLETTVRIHDAFACESNELNKNYSVGHVFVESKKVKVVCGDDTFLQLQIVQPAGKKVMDAQDWYRGLDPRNLILG